MVAVCHQTAHPNREGLVRDAEGRNAFAVGVGHTRGGKPLPKRSAKAVKAGSMGAALKPPCAVNIACDV